MPELERTLEAMGKLTAYTKQLDMAMFNDSVTDWYRDEFVREHLGDGQPAAPRQGRSRQRSPLRMNSRMRAFIVRNLPDMSAMTGLRRCARLFTRSLSTIGSPASSPT